MRKISFTDTNVSIAYVFLFDPFNNSSNIIFKEYDIITWSNLVKKEFEKIFKQKHDELIEFFTNLTILIEKSGLEFFSITNLINMTLNHDDFKDKYNNVTTTLKVLWQKYSLGDLVIKNDLLTAVNNCSDELYAENYIRRSTWLRKINLSKKRQDNYENINNKLLEIGVHEPDNQIILDAHDYNLSLSESIDFITFDNLCYIGAISIDEFSFGNIKKATDFQKFF